MNRGRKRRKGPNIRASSEQPSTSNSTVSEGQEIPSEGQEINKFQTCAEDTVPASQEDELHIPASKRSRLDLGSEAQQDNEPAITESTNMEHSQDDVIIVGDVQIARPEVIDLEKLPTIRQGGSVVVDLTADSSFHENNVVDLTRENALDSSIDSSPVVVCVNRIYRGDSLNQRSACRFASVPDMLDGIPCLLDDDIQEVMNSNVPSDGNAKLDSTNSITGEGGDGQSPKKITCPICLEDERTLRRGKRQLMSTTCGHVFCDKCIRNAVQVQSKCPTCRKRLTLNKLHPIFL